MNEDKRKYLEMIQVVISRLASNSFFLKGWSVTLAFALLSFAGNQQSPYIAILALLTTLIFWALDAYYLAQERLYRDLFDRAREGTSKVYVFDTPPLKFKDLRVAAVRPTTCVLHGAIAGIAILLAFVW